ncbi:MAG: SDR family oxidoreductase [Peptococcaceae bacterium]|jgi:NAD(P)-dependent dehydrogenase (short-subunit alcohol dehydrogenase family)|nr:SDR family oxidoreductase [Peptococcaceae bacterium]
MSLQGKTAIVTGGGTGIGAAITRRFVTDGLQVVITGRREAPLQQVAESLPAGRVVPCAGDVTQPEHAQRLVETALGITGHIDVLVNCAGVTAHHSITETDLEEWRSVIDINLHGPFLCMRAVIPQMIQQGGGSIINIASMAGLRCAPQSPAYCTSKAALIMLTQQAALDYGRYQIRCNAICPGFVYTDMTENEFKQLSADLGTDSQTFLASALRDVPLPPARPDKIAGVCSFLAGEDSAYLTGIVIPADGGSAIVDLFGAGIGRAITELGPKQA